MEEVGIKAISNKMVKRLEAAQKVGFCKEWRYKGTSHITNQEVFLNKSGQADN